MDSRIASGSASDHIGWLVRRMLEARADRWAAWRGQIVDALRAASDEERACCIDEVLEACINEGGCHGLDGAIDILSALGQPTLDYAWEQGEGATTATADRWFVLLRAVAQAKQVPREARQRFILRHADAPERGIKEGVVEALRDLGTDEAAVRLRAFAEDKDAFIRRIARESLEDMEAERAALPMDTLRAIAAKQPYPQAWYDEDSEPF